jgi:hypothetical protein
MSQATPSWDQGHMAALENVWGEYRTWAATARQQRAEIASWRFRVLLLTILGAGLGTLSQYLPTFSSVDTSAWLSPAGITGILSAMVIAFATYFSREILSPDRERRWIRARSVAEALKAEAYLFRTAVPPYDVAAAAVADHEAAQLVAAERDDWTECFDTLRGRLQEWRARAETAEALVVSLLSQMCGVVDHC